MIIDVQGDKRFLQHPFLDPVIATLLYLVLTSYMIFTIWPFIFYGIFFKICIFSDYNGNLVGAYNGFIYSVIPFSAFFFVSSFHNADLNENMKCNNAFIFFKNHLWLLFIIFAFIFLFIFSIFYTAQYKPESGGCYILECVPVEKIADHITDISLFPFNVDSLILLFFYCICFKCSSMKWIQICNKIFQECFWMRLRPGGVTL